MGVLNGLSKKEVLEALPKLLKNKPEVVKKAFSCLWGVQNESLSGYPGPVTPTELLITLHNMDSSKCDIKSMMMAIKLCVVEKRVYTQEVLAVVFQQLMEQNPLPTLMMRTVLQSLNIHPKLSGFVMNMLQRLIVKQVGSRRKLGKVSESAARTQNRKVSQSSSNYLRKSFKSCWKSHRRLKILCWLMSWPSQIISVCMFLNLRWTS